MLKYFCIGTPKIISSVYKENVMSSGSVFREMRIRGDKTVINFTEVGLGVVLNPSKQEIRYINFMGRYSFMTGMPNKY